MNFAILFPLSAFIAGAMTAYQPLINAKLNQHLDSPVWASFVSFAVGTGGTSYSWLYGQRW